MLIRVRSRMRNMMDGVKSITRGSTLVVTKTSLTMDGMMELARCDDRRAESEGNGHARCAEEPEAILPGIDATWPALEPDRGTGGNRADRAPAFVSTRAVGGGALCGGRTDNGRKRIRGSAPDFRGYISSRAGAGGERSRSQGRTADCGGASGSASGAGCGANGVSAATGQRKGNRGQRIERPNGKRLSIQVTLEFWGFIP